MIPVIHDRQVTSNSDQPATSFGISMKDSAHLMTILRDTLYSDKVCAVMREYGANAKDAHCDSGQKDRPIVVKVPTRMEPTLEIQDFGPGLSHEQVFTVFSQYGASTKRDSNDSIGYLGIGSKSGFAYSDSFTIISRNGGMCRTYVAVLDASEQGEIRLLDEKPCGDETGLTIQIGIRTYDIEEFRVKAAHVFRFYNPRPIINIELPPLITESTVLPGENHSWLAVMGGVSYQVDLAQTKVPDYLHGCGGVVFFNIGDLRVSASRESLKYDDHTKDNLVQGLNDTLDAWVARYASTVSSMSQWEKRVKLQGMGLFGKLLASVTFPGAFEPRVDIRDINTSSLRYKFGSVIVDPTTRFVFVDDRRSIKGFNLKERDYVVRRAPEHTISEAWDGLQYMITRLHLEGVPVVRTSELPWTKPPRSAAGGKHHYGKAFEYMPSRDLRRPLSNVWEPVDREESDDDVYVILQAFQTSMYEEYRQDRLIMNAFGLVPTVYGYRYREGNNVHAGTTYDVWRQGLYDMAVEKDPTVDPLMEALAWRHWTGYGPAALEELIGALGENHMISAVARKIDRAFQVLAKAGSNKIEAVTRLANKMGRPINVVPPEMKEVYEKYPLTDGRFELLLGTGRAALWIDYVLAMDLRRDHQAQAMKETDHAS